MELRSALRVNKVAELIGDSDLWLTQIGETWSVDSMHTLIALNTWA